MITSLQLQNFRSYSEASFEFANGVSIIVGPNASGKTNLLEALLVLCQSSSYRAKDIDLVSYHEPWARIDGVFESEKRIVTIEKKPEGAQKKYVLNTQTFIRLPFRKTVPAILFEPDHLQMLQAGPEKRRDFLDELLEKSNLGYGKMRRDYKRLLAQRNRLLKRIQTPDKAELFVWNLRLSEAGGKIAEARNDLLYSHNKEIAELYRAIANRSDSIELQYLAKYPIESYSTSLLKNLEKNFSIDRERGFTGDGPHREDFTVLLNGHDARISASRGESRTVLLALKLLEVRIVEQTRQKRPILLLDDVFSELDGARRKSLTYFLKDYQTFITTTDADVVLHHFIGNCSIIPTKN